MQWYFIRHGEIDSNTRNIYAGWNDEPLTETGIRQAEEAGIQLATKNIDAVYYSPLKRTEQTARIVGGHLNCDLHSDGHFIEFRLGPWEGLSEEQIAQSYPDEWKTWNTSPADLRLPEREPLQDLQTRVLKGLSCIKNQSDPSWSVAIITHVAIIRVVQLYYENRNLNDYKQIAVKNGKIFYFDSLRLDE